MEIVDVGFFSLPGSMHFKCHINDIQKGKVIVLSYEI